MRDCFHAPPEQSDRPTDLANGKGCLPHAIGGVRVLIRLLVRVIERGRHFQGLLAYGNGAIEVS
jgi:hypothetical protein